MIPTVTLNPTKSIGQSVVNFRLSDHARESHTLEDVMGLNGVLLIFVGDIWRPESVQRILGLQRYAAKADRTGCPFAVVVNSRVHTLANFMLSSPLPVPFPLLADPDGAVHAAFFAGETPSVILIDRARLPRYRWFIGEHQMLPPMEHVLATAQLLHDRMNERRV